MADLCPDRQLSRAARREDREHSNLTMGRYGLSLLCSECARFHSTKTFVNLEHGPKRVRRIDEVYTPNALPPEVPKLLSREFICPIMGKSVTPEKACCTSFLTNTAASVRFAPAVRDKRSSLGVRYGGKLLDINDG